MAVIEIAVLPFRPEPNDPGFLTPLRKGLEIQTKWMADTHPEKPSLNNPISVCYGSVNEPLEFIIVAKWESLEAHREWVQSDENKSVMSSLLPYLADTDGVSLVHIDGSEDESTPLPDSPFVVVERLLVQGGRRGEVTGRAGAAKEHIKAVAAGNRVLGGWRVDGEPGGTEEFALISSWNEVNTWEKAVDRPHSHFMPAEATARAYKRVQ
ncbi:hypothetical protein OQA88_11451 [Cercophora sp. LCS_1]